MSRIENALEHAIRRRETPVADVPPAPDNGKTAGEPLNCSSPYIVQFTEQDAHVAEEYRKLRSLVLKLTKKSAHHNMVMVTSSESGEGKSLTAVNLALVLAQEYNHTVLLVDADLRRPSLHAYLGVNPAHGLSDCIADDIDVGRAIMRTSMPRFSFLAAGKRRDKPAELISSNKMKALLHEMKNRYQDRIIIIDTPPALLFSETNVLSSYMDGILFVVKEGVSVSSVRAALDVLKEGPLLGIVYNDAHPEQLNGRYQRYYQYYHKSYHQGNGSDNKTG